MFGVGRERQTGGERETDRHIVLESRLSKSPIVLSLIPVLTCSRCEEIGKSLPTVTPKNLNFEPRFKLVQRSEETKSEAKTTKEKQIMY